MEVDTFLITWKVANRIRSQHLLIPVGPKFTYEDEQIKLLALSLYDNHKRQEEAINNILDLDSEIATRAAAAEKGI